MFSLIAALALTPVTITVTTNTPDGIMNVQLCDRSTFMTSRCPHQLRREAEREMDFIFEGVEPGDWAVMVWRDPESDGQMRTGIFGVPLEPTAISNNPPARFGPPVFDDSKLEIGSEPVSVRIRIR
jgi:uncharacterized protein (DUF2141 family)